MTPRSSPSLNDPGPPPGSADRELVEAVLRKDRKATADLVSAHATSIYSYVRRRLIPRADHVDDLVQDVFLAAWERLPAFRFDAPLRNWLMGIARHKVEDYYRARLRQPDAPVEDDFAPGSIAEQSPSIDELLDQATRHAQARKLLESLDEQYALVLLWRYWENRSAQEMAAQIGTTEKAVERLLSRAREQFRRRWNRG